MDNKTRRLEILMVDGGAQDCMSLQQEFVKQESSARIHFTVDAEEAIGFLLQSGRNVRAPRPSLILLDLKLDTEGGHEFLSMIKNDTSLLRIPIIVLADGEQETATAYDFHANCCVLKPRTPDQFAAFVTYVQSFWLDVILLPDQA